MSQDPRPYPHDEYHPHHPDVESDYMVLLMAIAASIPPDPEESEEPKEPALVRVA